jgi:DNA-binding NarL/FixJ family response regulator
MRAAAAIRVVICEDERVYRDGLCSLLGEEEDFETCGVFGDAEALLRAAAEPAAASWSVAVLDVNLPGRSGIDAARELKRARPGLALLMLTVHEDPATILAAICNGADGYLLKRAPAADILDALRGVVGGGATLTPGVARSLLGIVRDKLGPATARAEFDLSERELEVLRGLARGRSYKQVALDLGLSIDTVRTYVRRVYGKLQVHSVAEAIQRAIRAGIV